MIPSLVDKGAYLFSFFHVTVTEKITLDVACIELGRCFIGIERRSEYLKISLDRCTKAVCNLLSLNRTKDRPYEPPVFLREVLLTLVFPAGGAR
jgi:hypothetical protein